MSTAVAAGASLREFLVQLADDALAHRERKSGDHCGDCARMAAGRCPECLADEDMARRYKALALAIDSTASDEEAAAALAGGWDGGS